MEGRDTRWRVTGQVCWEAYRVPHHCEGIVLWVEAALPSRAIIAAFPHATPSPDCCS